MGTTNCTITIKNITLGEGMPKICIPLVGRTLSGLKQEAKALQALHPDLAEWRVDCFERAGDLAAVTEALGEIAAALSGVPLVFTFRSAREGGEQEISAEEYRALNEMAAASGLADLIDVELFGNEADVRFLIEFAHQHGVRVIVSNHDFAGTPPKEEIIARLRQAQALGGDLPKIAVMPQSASDVLTLLDATCVMREQYADRPIITMSMAGTGVISRLAGEVFGSAVTFGAAGKASAPGQIPAAELRQALELLHRSLGR